MAEYDKWVRRLVKLLLDLEFTDVSVAGNKHRKFRYDGPLIETPYTATVPSHIKSSSRRATLATIKRSLEKCGANDQLISRFDNFALGMLIAEPADEMTEIEDKLYDALKSNDRVLIAKIALQLGAVKGLPLEKLDSTAISRFETEQNDQQARFDIGRKIEKMLLAHFKMAFTYHLGEYGWFEINVGRYGSSSSQFSETNYEFYGYKLDKPTYDEFDPFELNGDCVAEIGAILKKFDLRTSFTVSVDNPSGEESYTYDDNSSVYSFDMNFRDLTLAKLEELQLELQGVVIQAGLGMKP